MYVFEYKFIVKIFKIMVYFYLMINEVHRIFNKFIKHTKVKQKFVNFLDYFLLNKFFLNTALITKIR